MAKSKNYSHHNQNRKNHRWEIRLLKDGILESQDSLIDVQSHMYGLTQIPLEENSEPTFMELCKGMVRKLDGTQYRSQNFKKTDRSS